MPEFVVHFSGIDNGLGFFRRFFAQSLHEAPAGRREGRRLSRKSTHRRLEAKRATTLLNKSQVDGSFMSKRTNPYKVFYCPG